MLWWPKVVYCKYYLAGEIISNYISVFMYQYDGTTWGVSPKIDTFYEVEETSVVTGKQYIKIIIVNSTLTDIECNFDRLL